MVLRLVFFRLLAPRDAGCHADFYAHASTNSDDHAHANEDAHAHANLDADDHNDADTHAYANDNAHGDTDG